MSKIVALRGVDGLGAGCGCAGAFGDDSGAAAPVVAPAPMSPATLLIWAGAIGTAIFIFWGTLQPKKRRLVS